MIKLAELGLDFAALAAIAVARFHGTLNMLGDRAAGFGASCLTHSGNSTLSAKTVRDVALAS